ncbi:MAG: hypothetical protein EOO81_12625, partial [Oxalobacteraceae bacterium]
MRTLILLSLLARLTLAAPAVAYQSNTDIYRAFDLRAEDRPDVAGAVPKAAWDAIMSTPDDRKLDRSLSNVPAEVWAVHWRGDETTERRR